MLSPSPHLLMQQYQIGVFTRSRKQPHDISAQKILVPTNMNSYQ